MSDHKLNQIAEKKEFKKNEFINSLCFLGSLVCLFSLLILV